MSTQLTTSRLRSWSQNPVGAALAVLVIGVLGAWLRADWQARSNEETAARKFSALAIRAADKVRARLSIYEYGLRGARGTVLAGGFDQLKLSGYRLYAYSREIDREFRGARGIGIIKRVPHDQVERFLDAMHRDERPDFTLRQLTPHENEHYVIQFLEPLERNRPAVGLDIGSETTRRVAAEAAMDTASATLTGPITLVQATGMRQRSFLLLLPIYRSLHVPNEVSERRAATWGWSYAPLVMDEVLADLDLGDLWLALRDIEHSKSEVFFSSGPTPQEVVNLARRVAIPIYGRHWEAELRATPAFVASMNLPGPRTIGALGTFVAALLAGLVFAYVQSAQRARQVRNEQARSAAIVASSTDAIVGESPDGLVTDWNQGAERLFGYAAAQAIGRHTASLIVPEARAKEDLEIREQLARGQDVQPFDTERRTRDGRLLDVSVSASPIAGRRGEQLGFAMTLRDISIAKSAERKVRELNLDLERLVMERTALLDATRRDLRNILDAMPTVIGYWDRELKNRFANHAYRDWYGVDPLSMPGLPAQELFGPKFNMIAARMQTALQGERQVFETRFQVPGSSDERNIVAHYIPDIVEGEIRGFYVIEFDITEQTRDRMRLAAALRENEALMNTIHEHAIVSVTDRTGRILEVNDNFCRVSRYSREELLGKRHSIVNSGQHDAEFWREMWRTIGRGQAWHGVLINRTKDGSLYWLDSMIAPIMGERGQIEKYVSIRIDITARKRVENELKQTHARMVETASLLRAVLESASEVSMIATDPKLKIKVWNGGAHRLLGYTTEEAVDRVTLVHVHDEAEVRARCDELSTRSGATVEGGEALIHPLALGETREWTYVRKDGTRVPVSLSVTAMRNDAGELFGYLGVARDVTREKEHEATLREAMEKAELASQAKSQFLANMSHEIRTPMNAVIGLTYLLDQTALDSEQTAFLTKIRLASKSLLALINDILDLSKIEARELVLEHVVVNLHSLLADLHDVMKVAADEKGLSFRIDVPSDLPIAVQADATRLHQILMNLLSNAIKFTDRGSVELRVRHRPLDPQRVELQFEVKDTGIGIPAEQQSRLFAPFAQADASTTRRFGGTGLGLSIVKRLANLMNGQAGLSSREGVGSTFWVRVELERAQGAALSGRAIQWRRESTRLDGVRVLVVDDSEINLDVARRILELQGAQVSLAHNGQEAFERLVAQSDAYHVVLMDLQMPVLGGREATRRIRGNPQLASVPIIALTADAREEERQSARLAGMTDFLTKPFEPAPLVDCIRRHVARHTASGEVPQSAPKKRATQLPEWPAIDGIDSAEASMRMVGDIELFRNLLSRLLNDFRAPTITSGSSADELSHAAAVLHTLRGAVGQLAAKQLYALASQAEVACREGDAEHAAQLCSAVAEQLVRLREAALARRFIEPKLNRTELSSGVLESPDLRELLELLDAQSFNALARFRDLQTQLQAHLAAECYEQVAKHLDGLRFAAAAQLLRNSCVNPVADSADPPAADVQRNRAS